MLAIVGLLLLVVSGGVFRWTLRQGSFRRYPHEQFILVGGSALIGLSSVLAEPNGLHIGLFAIELVAFGALVWYMAVGARFPRSKLLLETGEPFPSFSLRDSHGELFDSTQLEGKTALILFYRGPW